MDFTILVDTKFGWAFIISEIVLFYLAFLIIHRIVEKRLRGK